MLTCHLPLLEEFMADFSDIILQKRFSCRLINSFLSRLEWPSLFSQKKIYRMKRRFFPTKLDLLSFVSPENEIKEDHAKRIKIDNWDLHRKHSFI